MRGGGQLCTPLQECRSTVYVSSEASMIHHALVLQTVMHPVSRTYANFPGGSSHLHCGTTAVLHEQEWDTASVRLVSDVSFTTNVPRTIRIPLSEHFCMMHTEENKG